jgi:acetyltransferase-like isoleucine patch superfamily enzyme
MMLPHDWFPRSLPANISVGERTWIYSSFAFLHYQSRQSSGLRIGNDSGIYNGTFFDLGPSGEVEIGNFCAIVGAIISCDSRVVIGDYTFIAHEVVIADRHAATPPDEEKCFSEPYDWGGRASISIGANAWIGARAVLLAGARIGDGAIVGAAAVVDFEVPPHSVVAGNPAGVVSTIER